MPTMLKAVNRNLTFTIWLSYFARDGHDHSFANGEF